MGMNQMPTSKGRIGNRWQHHEFCAVAAVVGKWNRTWDGRLGISPPTIPIVNARLVEWSKFGRPPAGPRGKPAKLSMVSVTRWLRHTRAFTYQQRWRIGRGASSGLVVVGLAPHSMHESHPGFVVVVSLSSFLSY